MGWNVEKAKKERKSWYQYVFLAVAIRTETTGGREDKERELNAVAGSCAVATANS